MWDEIKGYLNNIDHPYKLYVNICGYTPNELPSDFNWKEYLNLHPDLSLKNLLTKDKVTKHFLRFGIREERNYKLDTRKKAPSVTERATGITYPGIDFVYTGKLQQYLQIYT